MFRPIIQNNKILFNKFIRFNSSQTQKQVIKSKWTNSFDKSMYYPGFLLILLGSQIMNVMNSQRKVEDLERRYLLKCQKIDELIQRLQDGEQVDVEEEMRLINKMFEKQKSGGFFPENKQRQQLQAKDDLKENDLIKLLGLDESNDDSSNTKITDTNHELISDDDQVKDTVQKEKDLLNYRLEPETHLIVEKPGDYIDSAKDTKVVKFL